MFYNNIKDYIYVNPTNDYVDDFQVYKYIQKDASLFGGEIYFNKETAVDWLSSETSLEFISGETSDRENLPLLSPVTINQSFVFDFDNSSFEISALAKGKKQNVSQFETQTDSYFLVNISGSHDLNFLNNRSHFQDYFLNLIFYFLSLRQLIIDRKNKYYFFWKIIFYFQNQLYRLID